MLGILPIDAVIGVALYWLAIGIAGIFMQSQPRLITKILFPAGADIISAVTRRTDYEDQRYCQDRRA